MSKISQMRTFLASCPYLDVLSAANIHVDWTCDTAEDYGIFPTGDNIVATTHTVTGDVIRTKQYTCVLYARLFTPGDTERIENSEFCENFADWLEEQQDTGTVPRFGDEEFEDDEDISASNGIIYSIDDNNDQALYQIQIKKTYKTRKVG